MKTKPVYKPIKFKEDRWEEIVELRDHLASDRHNDNLSLADTVSEAIKYYKESMTDPEEEN